MAEIFRTSAQITTDGGNTEAAALSANYWGDLTSEKMFPIPFWKVHQMLSVSSSNEIALRVVNIEDPNTMYADWIVFQQALADTLTNPTVEIGVRYYVISDDLFNGPVLPSTPPFNPMPGLKNVNSTPQNNVIRGRIGLDPNGNYFAYFQAAECVIINPGGGGGGLLSGLKVPTN